MPRIQGVDIPSNKKIEYALRYIYGIGPERAAILLERTNIDPNVRAHELSEEQLNKISDAINELGYIVEGELRREILENRKRLQSIKARRGLRFAKGLPVRGQRTKTNARTRKGGSKRAVGGLNKK